MNHDNRVLGRVGARDLTEKEAGQVTGGIGTLTAVCTNLHGRADGDVGDC